MRRERRKLNKNDDEISTKIIKYAAIGVGILAVIVFGLLLYSKSLNDEVKQGTLTAEQMANLMNGTNSYSQTESASTEMGKNVNEAKNEMTTDSGNKISSNATTINNIVGANSNITKQNNLNTNSISSSSMKNSSSKYNSSANSSIGNNSNNTNNSTSTQNNSSQNSKTETKKELSFQKPVEGDVVREFAKDNLIFSETLQEWTTHMGVDIKAEKTTIVKVAEAGTVKTIKNDPRYGLTIVVEHENGFQTIYANLLTSEFVVEGEKVEKGQSLGTVGNTAVFEVADEPHLHFEILKDSSPVDPTIYIK